MTNLEWQNEFWPKLTGLWPELNLTHEQTKQWAAGLKHYDCKVATTALDLLFQEGTKFREPRIHEVKRKCSLMAQRDEPEGARSAGPGLVGMYRASCRAETKGLTDEEIEMVHRQAEWEQFVVSYGPYAGPTITAWGSWQIAAEDAGYPAHVAREGSRRLRGGDEVAELYRQAVGDDLCIVRPRRFPELARELKQEGAMF